MRPLPVVLLVLSLSGCAAGTDGALTAQDAKSGLKAKDAVVAQLAQAKLSAISTAAQSWSAANGGSMAGFADDLRTTNPSAAIGAKTLTDKYVTVVVGNGRCWRMDLPQGQPAPAPC